MTSTLPSPRAFATSLITSLSSTSQQPHQSSQDPLPHDLKSLFLTLHVLFPTDLLSALDLLDRGLVTRLVLEPTPQPPPSPPAAQPKNEDGPEQGEQQRPDQPSEPPTSGTQKTKTAYYVHSTAGTAHHSATRTRRPSNSNSNSSATKSTYTPSTAPTQTYAVNLLTWTCSCPAFAFAAFPAVPSAPTSPLREERLGREDGWLGDGDWCFGGLTRTTGDAMPPVCKHLLACVLVAFGGLEEGEAGAGRVEERRVGREEWAGWAAGWGD